MKNDIAKSFPGVEFDNEGFLCHVDQWNKTIAERLAEQESISLSPSHWQVIQLLRDFYHSHELSPAMRPLIKFLNQQMPEKTVNSVYLLKLFPGSPAKLASKIAGLPKPDNCL